MDRKTCNHKTQNGSPCSRSPVKGCKSCFQHKSSPQKKKGKTTTKKDSYTYQNLASEIYKKIDKLLFLNYGDLPSWVKREEFFIEYRQKVLSDLMERILDEMTFGINALPKHGGWTVGISTTLLAVVLTSNEYELTGYDDDYDMNGANELKLSAQAVQKLKDFIRDEGIEDMDDYHENRSMLEKKLASLLIGG